jgi:hypothetical protein
MGVDLMESVGTVVRPEHPAWCCRQLCTAERAGQHISAAQAITARRADNEVHDLQVNLAAIDPRGVPCVTVEKYDGANPADEPEVLILSPRQAFLLARAVDGLLAAAWYPKG